MKTMKQLNNEIRKSAIDLHEVDFINITDTKGDIYRLYLSDKEYEANDGIAPNQVYETGTIGNDYNIGWMMLDKRPND